MRRPADCRALPRACTISAFRAAAAAAAACRRPHVRRISVTLTIRPIEPQDEARWRCLWDGYTRFYEREPDETLTRHTWARIMDPHAPVHAIVAVEDATVIGIANYILHENTSTLTPVCYLQDLYVDPDARAQGVGKQLIDWLIAEMKARGWSRLYWNTKENNYRARGLYDKYTPHSGFVRYVVPNEDL
ncbi:GNAT family N-acetyltransferase [Bordetella genomosp. 9]|nr:GNAT family N-acetyltransferase [Bordetella genomosp. 9]